MAIIYGWTYVQFHERVGWEKGGATVYEAWENKWAAQIDSYIFEVAGTHLTVAAEKAEIQTLVNTMMILTNVYLKAEVTKAPNSELYGTPGFPQLEGSPFDNKGIGSGDFIMLNKYKRKYDKTFARSDSIRIGVDPAHTYFRGYI